MHRLVTILIVLTLCAAALAEDLAVGEHAVAIRTTRVVRGEKEVAKLKFGTMTKVLRIEGDRVYVNSDPAGWVRAADVRTLDEGEKYFVKQLNKDPEPQTWQALADVRKKRWKNLLDSLTPVRVSDNSPPPTVARTEVAVARGYKHVRRARALLDEKKYVEAQREVDRALAVNPKMHRAVYLRGKIWEAQGESEKAVSTYAEYIMRNPKDDDGYHARAWVLATSTNDEIRHGERAIKDARTAGRLFEWQDSTLLDTLAAAFAESGKFKEAVAWQELAVRLAPFELEEGYKARLKLYREGKPYRHRLAQ